MAGESEAKEMKAQLSMYDALRAMHYARQGLRSLYGDRYSTEVDLRIELVRKVMKTQNLPPGDAAMFISRRADKLDLFVFAAAMEIVDQDEIKPELN